MEICRKTNLTFDLILSCMILDMENGHVGSGSG